MSQHVERIGSATLYLGDCREILPVVSPRTIISDPPYGIRYVHSGGGRGVHPTGRRNARMPIHGDDHAFDPTHLLSADRLLLWGANHYASQLPRGGTWIAWDKHTGIGPNDSFSDAEFAWSSFRTPRNVFRYLWKGVACKKAGEENGRRYHPTQKPLGLMRWCIETAGRPSVVCDPYMGSGSTGVAALQMGLQFIGVEFDRRFFDIACDRIERCQQQGILALDA